MEDTCFNRFKLISVFISVLNVNYWHFCNENVNLSMQAVQLTIVQNTFMVQVICVVKLSLEDSSFFC